MEEHKRKEGFPTPKPCAGRVAGCSEILEEIVPSKLAYRIVKELRFGFVRRD
jgi:hypothetical protein